MGFLLDWDLSYEEIDELLTDNPSLRSFVSGYAAEMKCRRLWFESDPRASGVKKWDDHDRTRKGDIHFMYREQSISVEVKSLQTNMVKDFDNGQFSGKFQCDASDKRSVVFDDGSSVETTCLRVGEFDLLAVNLFAFTGKWDFVFARNDLLPHVSGVRGASRNYTQHQKDNLLATLMPMEYPIISPYQSEPWAILDEIVAMRQL